MTHRVLLSVALGLGIAACGRNSAQAPEAPSVSAQSQAPLHREASRIHNGSVRSVANSSAGEVTERSFGAPFQPGLSQVDVVDLLSQPTLYEGHQVEAQGQVARVCKAMGCWMELKASGGDGALRVPMAGHAFFLPQDVVGARATVQGQVVLQPLTEAQRAHYRAEGMRATEHAVSLEAFAVRVEAP